MRRVAVFFLTMAFGIGISAQQHKTIHLVNVPGRLESAILSKPTPLLRHELGALPTPGTIRLFAVVTSDPISKQIVKGLEVQLEGYDESNDHNCKDTVYIDESALKELEWRLQMSLAAENAAKANAPGSVRTERPSVVFAANGSSNERDYYVPVEFGYYWAGDRFGVYVHAPSSQPVSSIHPTTQFRMPKADISELAGLVHDGRLWLQQHPFPAKSTP